MRLRTNYGVLSLLWVFTGCNSSGGQSGTEAIDVTGKDKPVTTTDAGGEDPDPDAQSPRPMPSDTQGSEIELPDAQGPLPMPSDTQGSEIELPDAQSLLPSIKPDASTLSSTPQDTYIDFYQVPCNGGEGQYWCYRVSLDGVEYQLSYDVRSVPNYQWGFRAFARGHFVANDDLVPDAPLTLFIYDQAPEYTPVEAGTRFTIPLMASAPPRIELSDEHTSGTLLLGPTFSCTPHLCDTLALALDVSDTEYEATFEFDADQQLTLVQVNPADYFDGSFSASADVDTLRDAWHENAPSSYVVKTCGMGFNVPSCDVAAVVDGIVVAQATSFMDDWTTTDPADFKDPLEALFDDAYTGADGVFNLSYKVDPTWGYISGNYYSGPESGGIEVTCFEADATELSACQ